ncbi:ATP-dependent protease ClpP, protease subunit [Streptococcus henryi]|uniref:ATP-dependent protease ClpP, protease subunit n=1 Tax=Streptococcus henryi TaxID=439219 RepID=A0A1G6AJW6_9STRE|nr:head maturation protease, ClpP-related [Streptococcus henryi]QBX25323.1 Clp protease-like protein [Streptococcus phage Javan252]SDB08698.1 ATP-dependent protease ClpP, protease subunit [Streptococcus henryi]
MGKIDIKGDVVDNIYGEFYDYWGIDSVYPKKIQQAIENDEDEEITLDVASNGGDVFSASEIYTMLKASGKKITVNIQGLAASAASVISMAGDVIRMSPTAQMMIHKASNGTYGNSDDMRKNADMLDNVDMSIVNAYALKTGRKDTDVLQLMQDETWMTAQKAVDLGFADEIMFVDSNKPLVTNSLHNLPSKDALNKFLNMVAKEKQPVPKPTASLRDKKLAILLQK